MIRLLRSVKYYIRRNEDEKRYLFKLAVFIAAVNLPFITVDLTMANEKESKKITYDSLIQYNLENDTTGINRNVERKLNAYGITDEQITRIPQDYLENIYEQNGNITVEKKYYGYVSQEEDKLIEEDINDSNLNMVEADSIIIDGEEYESGKLVELTEEEIDEVINEKYNDEYNKVYKNDKMNFVNTAYASNVSKYEDTQPWKYDGELEVCEIITYGPPTDNGLRTIDVYAMAEWIKEPKHRGEDVLGIVLHPDTMILDETIQRSYTFTYMDFSNPGIIVPFPQNVSKSKLPVECCGNAFFVKFNLADDKSHAYARNHVITLRAMGMVINTNTKYTWANAYYWHKKTKISSSTGVQFSATSQGYGISVYTTPELKTVVAHNSPPPYVRIVFK